MKKKMLFNFLILILGIALIAVSFLLKSQDLKSVSGICIGIGAGLFGMSLSNLYLIHFEEKNPEVARITKIELEDERNTIIRNRAKAKSGDITHWFIIAIAYITILINAPLWVTLAVVGVFSLYNLLSLFYMHKYQKEM